MLLDPFTGAVQNGMEPGFESQQWLREKTGVRKPVNVYFDDRKVPHIYAQSDYDMYFAQGYVTASLRLWQMDFISYASAGRLSELLGTDFFDYDRNQRRIGIPAGARKSWELIKKDPVTSEILTAYTNGVNAYIKQLNYREMPLEYKLLNYRPESWSELKTVLVMKYMANLLSGYEEDFSMSNAIVALGEKKFNSLFPDFPSPVTPVANPLASQNDTLFSYIKKPAYLDYSFLSGNTIIENSTYNPKLGSNSWAVSGKKTKSGFPMLCNDPHLNLSLPAVWVEMQLSCPGVNVYGVSIPGTPAVIVGFNESIAWGLTNGADDVKDWYKLKITNDYKKYELDGKWIDLKYYIERIKRKDQGTFSDTVYYTVHGPVVFDKSFPGKNSERRNYALKWQLHNSSNEFLTFIKLNRAKNYADYKAAITTYSCPVQNFTFACKDDTIAINHQGRMLVKKPGEGKFLLDGTKSNNLYDKYIPQDSLPAMCNPVCNYVLSANQHPTATSYPYYYNGYYSENRANRIHQLLNTGNDFDMKAMQYMQLDNTSAFAVDALPAVLNNVNLNALLPGQRSLFEGLHTWSGAYNFNDEYAELFELWWKYIKDYTWDEFKTFAFYVRKPDDYILLNMIRNDPANIYFDKQETSETENAGDIVQRAFVAATADYNELKKKGSVRWGYINKVSIMHLTNIPAFSCTNLPSSGYHEAINAVSSNWGPSWRMIVELGARPKAVGIYPGGQSGNMGSPYYNNFINDWNQGKYYQLNFFMTQQEAREKSHNTWILQ